MKKERVLTENQKKFLDALFGEAKGNATEAKRLAGYAETVRTSEIISSLREEIRETTLDILAANGPKAAHELTGVLSEPNQAGALNKIKVAQDILNRIGASSSPAQDVNLKVPQGGLFIMPAKEHSDEEKMSEVQ